MLAISGLNWAKRHKRDFDAVLTIEDPRQRKGLRFHRQPRPAHLILQFYDLDEPVPPPLHQPWMTLATHDDIQAAIAFGQQYEDLLIHCMAGVARSTGLAWAIQAARCGDPLAAFEQTLRVRPIAIPNRHVVMLADEVLGYGGRMLDILDEWDRSIPANALRRRLCRAYHYYEFGLPFESTLPITIALDAMYSQMGSGKRTKGLPDQ